MKEYQPIINYNRSSNYNSNCTINSILNPILKLPLPADLEYEIQYFTPHNKSAISTKEVLSMRGRMLRCVATRRRSAAVLRRCEAVHRNAWQHVETVRQQYDDARPYVQPVQLNAQPVRKRMSPVPNDNPITPLMRRSSKSTSPIIELNSDVENTTSLLDDYCRSAILHQGCRTTHFHVYPTTTNLHQGCRATDADCGTSHPFIAIQTTARQQGEDSKRCAARGTILRGTKDRGTAERRT